MKKMFIATAMSGLTDIEYKTLRTSLLDFKEKSNEKFEIFSEITNVENQDKFLSPKEATLIDIEEIKKSNEFVLLHFSNIQSSTLFELGIAYAENKNITIFYFNEKDLPFMLKELNQVSSFVKLIQIESFDEISKVLLSF